jgi:hypothetical protein
MSSDSVRLIGICGVRKCWSVFLGNRAAQVDVIGRWHVLEVALPKHWYATS